MKKGTKITCHFDSYQLMEEGLERGNKTVALPWQADLLLTRAI
jgi:hypothetical protein